MKAHGWHADTADNGAQCVDQSGDARYTCGVQEMPQSFLCCPSICTLVLMLVPLFSSVKTQTSGLKTQGKYSLSRHHGMYDACLLPRRGDNNAAFGRRFGFSGVI